MADAAPGLTPAVPKPAHVPEALVYDFDLWRDPGMSRDPHGRIGELLAEAPPIFWSPRQGGAWFLAGHEVSFDAARDWDSFTSEFIPLDQLDKMNAERPAGSPHIPIAFPINLDPPLHGKYRLPLNAAFSPKAMNALKDDVRALARELIKGVAKEGRCEFMSAVAEPLPVKIFLKLMGLPVERFAEYRAIVKDHFTGVNDPETTIRKSQEVVAVMRDTFLERRDHPQDDLISRLWAFELDGRPPTLDDMENYGLLLFLAGLDTVMQGMGYGACHLAQHPELQARLRANPELSGEATEELLRRYTFTVPPRIVAKDLVFQGVEMRKGERAWLLYPSADLDPRRWSEPMRFDLDREDKTHIAFGSGPHRCVGSHLARIELQILNEELLAGLPPFRLDPERPPTFHGGSVIGVDSLDLLWDVEG